MVIKQFCELSGQQGTIQKLVIILIHYLITCYSLLALLPASSIVHIHDLEIHDENSPCFSLLQLLLQLVPACVYLFI